MFNKALLILALIIPSLGMMAGLSIALTVSLYLATILIVLNKDIKFILVNKILELTLIGWALLSSLWSANLLASLWLSLSVSVIFIAGLILIDNIDILNSKLKSKASLLNYVDKIYLNLLAGITLAIILFFIEKLTDGILIKTFRTFFQHKQGGSFFALHMLDRGCAMLSLIAWIIIGVFVQQKRYLSAITLYFVVLYILNISDSLASALAFICAGLVFILASIFGSKFYKLMRVLVLAGLISIVFIAHYISPLNLAKQYEDIIPDSAKHRLFIWHFVADKILEKPIIGCGMSGSKYLVIQESEIIKYKENLWSPLPLHPHNNILQILFELGSIGFFLTLLLINKFLKNISNNENRNKLLAICLSAWFTNYLVIGMISYSVWQIWWVAAGVFSAFMINWFISK